MARTRQAYRAPHIDPIIANQLKDLAANWGQGGSGNFSRQAFFKGFEDPRRDLNADCGYPTTPLLNPDRYRNLYDEDPIANRVVQLLPKECWKVQPMIFESEDPKVITPWEEAWDDLKKTIRGEQCWFEGDLGDPIIEYWKRADILHGIGYFGVILLGIDDGKNLDQPVDGVATLIPTANSNLAVNVRKDGSKAVRVRRPKKTLARSLAAQAYEHLVKNAPSRPSKEADYRIVTKTIKDDNGEWVTTNEKVYYDVNKGDEPIGGWDTYNAKANGAVRAEASSSISGIQKSQGTPGYSTSTPNSPSPNGSGDIDKIGTSSVGGANLDDQQNDIVGQKDAAEPEKSDPANKGSIAPTSFAGAQGTDAQYVGVELSPPEFPSSESSPQEHKLLFIRTFDESLVQIVQYEADLRNPRFGQPVMYRITLNDPRDQHSGVGLPIATVRVHWSRIIHLTDNRGSSEIFGVPRMRPVLHPILDDMKVRGAGAEGYWQSCFTKTSWETHPQLGGDVIIDEAKMRYMFYMLRNTLERDAVSSGMTAKSLAPEVVDPTPHHAMQLETICINVGCPVRVFKGSERGELASSQDDAQWNDVVAERQNNYLTPRLIVPFIDRLISMGILPEPDEGYFVEWPDLDATTKKDKAAILLQRTQAYSAYVAGNVEAVIPIEVYMTQFDNMTDEQAMATMEAAKANVEAGLQTMPQPGELGHPATEEEPPLPPMMGGGQSEIPNDDGTPQSDSGNDSPVPSSNNPADASDQRGGQSNRTQVGNTEGLWGR